MDASDVTLVMTSEQRGYIDSRIGDVEKAAVRSRWIYGLMSALSLLLFSAAYNEYFSWSRAMAMGLTGKFDQGEWKSQLDLLLMKEWLGALQFDVPYLGGKFGASDAGIIGGVVLFIAAVWCYYSARRENRQVYFLVKDFREFKFSKHERFYLSNQLYSTQLFVSESARPAYDAKRLLRKYTPEYVSQREKNGLLDHLVIGALRLATFFVFMTPALALMFVFVTDILTLSKVSPFRNDGIILYVHLCKNPDMWHWWRCEDTGLLVRLGLSLLLLIFVTVIMWKAKSFQRGTEEMVHYTKRWKGDLLKKIGPTEFRPEDIVNVDKTPNSPAAESRDEPLPGPSPA